MHATLRIFAWALLASVAAARPFSHAFSRAYERAFRERLAHVPDDFHAPVSTGREWYQKNFQPSVRCMLDERLGAVGDGGKWTCDPSKLLHRDECVVFSVGSSNEWSFDAAFERFGCAVHTWDHTVASVMNKPDSVTFHPIGLGVTNDTNTADLRKMCELAGVDHVDILKVDCEGCEWNWLSNDDTMAFMSAHVTQFLVEFHFQTPQLMEQIAGRLTNAGFRVFSVEPNIQYSDGSCIEYSFVNVNLVDVGGDESHVRRILRNEDRT